MVSLRPYQQQISKKASEILRSEGVVYLSMEVRTGKTLTSLKICDEVGATKVLFVTKKKAISSIEKDYMAAGFEYSIIVTNYEQLHKINDVFEVVVVDEAHSVGAFPKPSIRARELRRIIKSETMVIYLSGTPTPESFSQFYHQLWVSHKGPWVGYINFYKWAAEYVIRQTKYLYNREIADYSKAKKEMIEKDMQPLMISYTQEEAGFEMPVQEYFITVKMQPSTYYLADKLKRDRLVESKDGRVIEAGTAVKLMQKLHQVYSGTVIFENHAAKVFDHSKAEAIFKQFAGKKIAIFYKFIAEMGVITWQAAKHGRKITTDVDEFEREGAEVVFTSQIQSGREGINLATADALVFYNIDFSAVSYWQARARLQSKDRDKEAAIYWVFSEGGIEEKIYGAVMNKKDYTLTHFKKDFKI